MKPSAPSQPLALELAEDDVPADIPLWVMAVSRVGEVIGWMYLDPRLKPAGMASAESQPTEASCPIVAAVERAAALRPARSRQSSTSRQYDLPVWRELIISRFRPTLPQWAHATSAAAEPRSPPSRVAGTLVIGATRPDALASCEKTRAMESVPQVRGGGA